MENLCNCNGDVSNLGEPDYCGDIQMIRQPDYISISKGKYYEDGNFRGYVIEMTESEESSSVTVKYKISSPNRYLNGEIVSITFTPKDKRE